MRKSRQTKGSSEARGKTSVLQIARTYFLVIRLLHKDLGAVRIIAAYLFLIFAVLSLLFTIRVPVSSDFLPPTGEVKAQSRVITGFMMIINIIVYGIIMNWRKGGAIRTAIRIALIGSALYLDVLLIQIVYMLIRDGTFF